MFLYTGYSDELTDPDHVDFREATDRIFKGFNEKEMVAPIEDGETDGKTESLSCADLFVMKASFHCKFFTVQIIPFCCLMCDHNVVFLCGNRALIGI